MKRRLSPCDPARRFLPMVVIALFSLADCGHDAFAQKTPAGDAKILWRVSDGAWPRGENLLDPGAWGAPPAPSVPSLRPRRAAPAISLPERQWGMEASDALVENPALSFSTFCVRSCDGFYWPLAFATPKHRLAEDADRCAARCGGKARLYMTPTPDLASADPAPIDTSERLVDLDGRHYRDMERAFLYRSVYMRRCGCKRHQERLIEEEVDEDDDPETVAPAKTRSATAVLMLTGIVKRLSGPQPSQEMEMAWDFAPVAPQLVPRRARSEVAAQGVRFAVGD